MKSNMIETDVERTVCLRAAKRGWLIRKVAWIGRIGAPDRIFIKDGRVIFVEFKRPGRKPREAQDREIARLRSFGVECYVISDIGEGDALFA